jgi:hypothetical protein
MAQQLENTTERLQSAEILYINNILKGIDRLAAYRNSPRVNLNRLLGYLADIYDEFLKLETIKELREEIYQKKRTLRSAPIK